MEKLDVKSAKNSIFGLMDKTNKLVQAVHGGSARSCHFIDVIRHLIDFGTTLGFSLVFAVEVKQEIDERKYPPGLNQGIVVDYKLVSSETGIHKYSASDIICNLEKLHTREDLTGQWMEAFLARSKAFVGKRNWCKYEQPRMLSLAMMEEVGELCGVLKFIDDSENEVSRRLYGEMVSEICDIFIYFCRLSDLCGFFEHIKEEASRT